MIIVGGGEGGKGGLFLTFNFSRTSFRTFRKVVEPLLWALYALFIGCIGVSRCYLSAHFPHQIIGGMIAGISNVLWFIYTRGDGYGFGPHPKMVTVSIFGTWPHPRTGI